MKQPKALEEGCLEQWDHPFHLVKGESLLDLENPASITEIKAEYENRRARRRAQRSSTRLGVYLFWAPRKITVDDIRR